MHVSNEQVSDTHQRRLYKTDPTSSTHLYETWLHRHTPAKGPVWYSLEDNGEPGSSPWTWTAGELAGVLKALTRIFSVDGAHVPVTTETRSGLHVVSFDKPGGGPLVLVFTPEQAKAFFVDVVETDVAVKIPSESATTLIDDLLSLDEGNPWEDLPVGDRISPLRHSVQQANTPPAPPTSSRQRWWRRTSTKSSTD